MKKGAALGILAAMVGAGIASGREIMFFYSRFGAFSWFLVLFSGGLIGLLTARTLLADDKTAVRLPGKCLLGALYLAVGGGMTAAAGELAALTVPIRHVSVWGGALTLLVCAFLARKALAALNCLGGALLFGMAALFFMCLAVPGGSEMPSVSPARAAGGIVNAGASCGMNVLLARAVIREGGGKMNRKEKRGLALRTGLLAGGLLALGNGALLSHGELTDAALPTVMLLRSFGKTGYYLSAAVLYLAVATTLTAVLGGFFSLLPEKWNAVFVPLALLGAGGASLIGFEGAVSRAYPVLGLCGLLLLLRPRG